MLSQVDTFVGPDVSWFALSPLLTLALGGLGMLVLGALTPRWPKGAYASLSVAIAAIGLHESIKAPQVVRGQRQ